MAEMHDQMKQMTKTMTQQQQLLQNAVIQTNGTLSAKPKFKVAQPESFGGRCDRTSLEDWLFKLRQYFEIKEMDGQICVQFATTLLTEDAAIWWRNHINAVDCNEETLITDWREFQRAILAQFKPVNSVKIARDKLASLRQTKSVSDYIAQFCS